MAENDERFVYLSEWVLSSMKQKADKWAKLLAVDENKYSFTTEREKKKIKEKEERKKKKGKRTTAGLNDFALAPCCPFPLFFLPVFPTLQTDYSGLF